MDDLWLVVVILVAVVAALAILAYVLVRALTGKRGPGRRADEARVLHGAASVSERGETAEVAYTGDFFPGTTGKNAKPSHLIVRVACEIPGDFTLVPEGWFDRFCKRFGLAHEIQTGDRLFDELCYVQTDTPEFARTYLADGERRQAVRRLFEMGFRNLDHDGTTLTATWTGYPHGEAESADYAQQAAEALVPLTRNVPARPAATGRRWLSRKRLGWAGAVGLFGGIAALVALTLTMSANGFPVNHWGLLGTVLPVVGLALLVYLWLAAWLVRGHSTSHLQFFSLAVAGVLILPPVGVLVAERLNRWLDGSPAKEHVQMITGKEAKKRKNSTSYTASLPHWDDPARTLELRIDSSTFGRIDPNRSRMKVVTHAGWLGFEWIESCAVQGP